MKTFLIQVDILDGEHEHIDHGLVEAHNEFEATEKALAQIERDSNEDCEQTFWGYGDGTTIAHLRKIEELTEAEINMIRKLRLVYYID